MERLMRTPSRYVQEKDVLLKMKDHVEMLGDSLYIVASRSGMRSTRAKIEESFKDSEIKLIFEEFNGESTWKEIDRIRDLVKKNKSNLIVGVGGGKTIDTAKAVAHFEKLPIVVVPTVVATDAPCTALSVVYTDEGEFSDYLFYPVNPDVVIVDTDVVAKAPVRFLVSGMGDALATYFEARACRQTLSPTLAFGGHTEAGFALSKLCYETLLEYGAQAKLAVENQVVTEALEKVVEANTYLSGVGAENGGLAAAHSIYNGLTIVKECDHKSHGELVAFGTLVQLVMEGAKTEEIKEVLGFCRQVGLPTSLEEIGLSKDNSEEIKKAAELACQEGESIHNMLGGVSPEKVYNAIMAADGISKIY